MTETVEPPNIFWITENDRKIGSVVLHRYRTGGDCYLARVGVGAARKPCGIYPTRVEAERAVRREYRETW